VWPGSVEHHKDWVAVTKLATRCRTRGLGRSQQYQGWQEKRMRYRDEMGRTSEGGEPCGFEDSGHADLTSTGVLAEEECSGSGTGSEGCADILDI
jgi:hypothetical protein